LQAVKPFLAVGNGQFPKESENAENPYYNYTNYTVGLSDSSI